MSRARDEVLRQLGEYGESYGLDLIKRSGGILKRGTVYVLLDRMEQEGLIVSRTAGPPLPGRLYPRRIYKLAPPPAKAVD